MNSTPPNGVVIVVAADETSFVHNAVAELRARMPVSRVVHDLADVVQEPLVLVVGREMAQRAGFECSELKPQEFRIRSIQRGSGRMIVAVGGDSQGTNYAVLYLQRVLIEAGNLNADLDVHEAPRFPVRGIYLHQHWHYNHPYATWSWSAQDWKRAIDMAAHMRFNLILIWPHADMMAPPLSVQETKQLAGLREAIDHAHGNRGIKVWLVEPANVLLDQPAARRLPIEERDYYAYAHMRGGGLKNPADPRDRGALLANREELYRLVPNADGYGYIDSDPGGWIGSPAGEFVDLLAANRELIDRHHERPEDVTLFHWALAGWGNRTAEENWRDTMRGVVERVRGPRGFLACFAHHVENARELGHLAQTLLFPYGVIEGEPSFPLTGFEFDQLDRAFKLADGYSGLAGVIGNVQTFLAQLPNIYCTARLGWDATCAQDPSRLLHELARQLFPDDATALADAWLALQRPDASRAIELAAHLDAIPIRHPPPRLGTLGAFVFPRASILLEDLATMLGIHAAALKLPGNSDPPRAVANYVRGMLNWQKRNGFFGTYGVDKQVLYDQFMYNADAQTVAAAIENQLGPTERLAIQESLIAQMVSERFDESIVRAMIGQLCKTSTTKMGEIEESLFKKLPPASQTMPWTQPPTLR